MQNLIKILKKKESPFVFLESSVSGKKYKDSYLFTEPEQIICTNRFDEVETCFRKLDCFSKKYWLAGYVAYEAAFGFNEKKLQNLQKQKVADFDLVWFGVFQKPMLVRSGYCGFPGGNKISRRKGRLKSFTSEHDYYAALRKIKQYIREGDTYQVNYTFDKSYYSGKSVFQTYLDLREQQPTCFSAFISTEKKDILSFSPELFFERNKSIVNVNPMKGTVSRGFSCEEDLRRKKFLLNDAKNLSENIMIVDLLRNDLGKISQTGSVKVKRLFEIQEHSTLYQMTSGIESKLDKGVLYYDIFKALFPCGSVTGAPKIRTMEIIEEVEKNKRDVYCGAIGFISPRQRAVFSVPIRTLYKKKKEKAWTYRVGSGIVWDSQQKEEWLECGVKTKFLSQEILPDFFIFETLLLQKGRLIFRKEHLRRLKASAKFFGFPYCEESLVATIDEIQEKQIMQEKIIKIILRKNGAFAWEKRDYKKSANKVPKVVLSKKQIDNDNLFLYHKTSYRPWYDKAMTNKQKGFYFDKLFFNTKGELTEGTRTNVFVEKNSQLYTPCVDSGLLPGVLRGNLLANNICKEKVLYVEDLQRADAVYCGNSVRGLVQVVVLF